MRAIDADKLPNHKFVGVENMQILMGRRNGKTMLEQTVNNAYKIGWNHAIEAIVENEPSINADIIRCKDCKYQAKVWVSDRRMKNKGYWDYGCKFFGELSGYWCWGGEDNQFCSSAERRKRDD